MAQRLLAVAHGATAGTREVIFGDSSSLSEPEGAPPASTQPGDSRWLRAGRVLGWYAGPEPACAETAIRLGGQPVVAPLLAGPDFGSWRGRTLAEVAAADPEGLRHWLADPAAAPHGGESLAEMLTRVGAYCDSEGWPHGRTVLVVTSLVARAIAVHALDAPAEVLFRIDLAPLGRVGLSRSGATWRLQQLGQPARD